MELPVNQSTAQPAVSPGPWPLRVAAHIISMIFHPLFIPSWVTAFLLFVHPGVFAGMPDEFKWRRFISVFLNTAFIPGFSVFLMWRLKLIQSLLLRTQKERIIPYAAAIIFYFWAWYVLSRQEDSPEIFIRFLKGSFFAVCGAWMFNINSKISMHATAMGATLLFFFLLTFTDSYPGGLYLSAAMLVAGMVCTARLLVSDHNQREIYTGLVVGAICQLLAWWI